MLSSLTTKLIDWVDENDDLRYEEGDTLFRIYLPAMTFSDIHDHIVLSAQEDDIKNDLSHLKFNYIIFIQDYADLRSDESVKGNGIEVNICSNDGDYLVDTMGDYFAPFYSDLSNNGMKRFQQWLDNYCAMHKISLTPFPILDRTDFRNLVTSRDLIKNLEDARYFDVICDYDTLSDFLNNSEECDRLIVITREDKRPFITLVNDGPNETGRTKFDLISNIEDVCSMKIAITSESALKTSLELILNTLYEYERYEDWVNEFKSFLRGS